MADAPKTEGGGGWGFLEVTIAILVVLAVLSGALKGTSGTTSSGSTPAGDPAPLTSTLGSTDGSCTIALAHPIGYEFVGTKKMKVQGTLANCTTADPQTAFFLQVLDSNTVPVSNQIAVPIISTTDGVATFNMTIVFTGVPRTKRGTAIFTPDVQNVSPSQALRVPVVFVK